MIIKALRISESRIRQREFREAESGIENLERTEPNIGAGQHLEKRWNSPKGFPESSITCGLKIPRVNFIKMSEKTHKIRLGDSEGIYKRKRRERTWLIQDVDYTARDASTGSPVAAAAVLRQTAILSTGNAP